MGVDSAVGDTRRRVESVFRDAYGQAVGTLVRIFGDITLAEDAVQDAFVRAMDRWPLDGIPPNPAGWIVTTSRNRAIDVVRRVARGRDLHAEAAGVPPRDGEVDEGPVDDDQLRLIFTCCHPALAMEHRIALTLRLLGGLTIAEVARAFLASEAAMAKRLVRAKYKIGAAGIPYRVPSGPELAERLGAVLVVVSLIYTIGADDPGRASLRADALRLARSLARLMPDEPEAAGLLALLLLNESRAAARVSADGGVVLLADQDRMLWDRDLIEEGHRIVRRCIELNRPGPYQLQAAIQAVHGDAGDSDQTDWSQIVTLYDHLYTHTPTPVVALNRAIAIGEVDGPVAALRDLDAVADALEGFHLLHTARAAMLVRLHRIDEARTAYRSALSTDLSDRDRRFVLERLADLG